MFSSSNKYAICETGCKINEEYFVWEYGSRPMNELLIISV